MKVHEKLLFAPGAAIIAILLANPVQILWDLACVYLQKMKVDKDNAKQGCLLLTYQVTVCFLFIFILFYTIHFAIIVV